MHVVIKPELVMEVEARMNRAYLPSRLLPPHLRGSTHPHHRKSSLFQTSAGNFCTFVKFVKFLFYLQILYNYRSLRILEEIKSYMLNYLRTIKQDLISI